MEQQVEQPQAESQQPESEPQVNNENPEESATNGDDSQYYQQEEYSTEEQDGEETEFNVEDQLAAQQNEQPATKTFNIFVGDLNTDVNEDDLRNLFYVCGEIDKVHIFRDPHTGEHKGFGFIHFKTKEAQQKALSEFNNYMIKGRPCRITPSEEKDTLFVGNLPMDLTEEQIKQAFHEIIGTQGVLSIELKTGPPPENRSRGFCFIQLVDHQKADQVKKILKRSSIKNRPLNVSWAETKGSREVDESIMATVKTLYVSNISITVNEQVLSALFSDYGVVKNCVIVKNPQTRQSRGFAFVEFEQRESAEKALEALNGKEVSGQKLSVVFAKPAPKTKPKIKQMAQHMQPMNPAWNFSPYGKRGGMGAFVSPTRGRGAPQFGRGGMQYAYPHNGARGRGAPFGYAPRGRGGAFRGGHYQPPPAQPPVAQPPPVSQPPPAVSQPPAVPQTPPPSQPPTSSAVPQTPPASQPPTPFTPPSMQQAPSPSTPQQESHYGPQKTPKATRGTARFKAQPYVQPRVAPQQANVNYQQQRYAPPQAPPQSYYPQQPPAQPTTAAQSSYPYSAQYSYASSTAAPTTATAATGYQQGSEHYQYYQQYQYPPNYSYAPPPPSSAYSYPTSYQEGSQYSQQYQQQGQYQQYYSQYQQQ